MKYHSIFVMLSFVLLFSVTPVLAEDSDASTNTPVGDYVQEVTPSKAGTTEKKFVPPGIGAIRQGRALKGTRPRTLPPSQGLKTTIGVMRKELTSERATLRKQQNSELTKLMEEYRTQATSLNEAYRKELTDAVQAGKTKEEIDAIRKDYLAKRKALLAKMNTDRKSLTTTNIQNRKNLKEDTKAERKNFFQSIRDWWKSLSSPKSSTTQ